MTKKTLSLALALTFGIQTLGPVAFSQTTDGHSNMDSAINSDARQQIARRTLSRMDKQLGIIQDLISGMDRIKTIVKLSKTFLTSEDLVYFTDFLAALGLAGHSVDKNVNGNSVKLMAQSAASVAAAILDVYNKYGQNISIEDIAKILARDYKKQLQEALAINLQLNPSADGQAIENSFQELIGGFMKLGDKMTGGQEHVSTKAINAKNYTTIVIGVYLAASGLVHFFGKKGGGQALEQAETRLLLKLKTAIAGPALAGQKTVGLSNVAGLALESYKQAFLDGDVQAQFNNVLIQLNLLQSNLQVKRDRLAQELGINDGQTN